MSNNILNIIESIRDSFEESVQVYTQGGCIRFCLILSTIFPQGEIYYDEDHAIFKLDNKFYDITGEVNKENHINIKEYSPYRIDKLFKLKNANNICTIGER